jgi:intracellular septation protein A
VRAFLRHASPTLVESTLIPLGLFTALVHGLGLQPALWGSLMWSYGALARRALRGRRIPGILLLSAVGITFRLVTMVFTGSAFLFFFQPVLATVATALVFAVSVIAGRPLAARLGADLVPLPEAAWGDPCVRRLCKQLSAVWAVALLANAALTAWMLVELSVANFVLLKPAVSVVTTLPAVIASVLAGRALLRRAGTRLAGPSLPSLAALAPAATTVPVPALALAG